MNNLLSILPSLFILVLIIHYYKNERRKVLSFQEVFGNYSPIIIDQINHSFQSIRSDYTWTSIVNGEVVQSRCDGFNNIGIVDYKIVKEFCLRVNGEDLRSIRRELTLKKDRLRRFQMNSLLKEEFEAQIDCLDLIVRFIDCKVNYLEYEVEPPTHILEIESQSTPIESQDKYNKYPELTNDIFKEALGMEALILFDRHHRIGNLDLIDGDYHLAENTKQAKVIRLAIEIWDRKLIDYKPFEGIFSRYAYTFMKYTNYYTDAKDPLDQFKKMKNKIGD